MAHESYLTDAPAGAALPQPAPRVSFCIPTRNRERTIGACLESIRAQRYPDVEVVVVDNGSTDGTVAVAERYADVVGSCDGQLGAVRQRSIDLSSGAVLALFDDDIVIPHDGWLAGAVAALLATQGASTLWPALVPPPGAGWPTRCFFELNDAIFASRRGRPSAVFGGGNSLFLRSAVEAAGGFDPAIGFGEDFDLAARLKAAGHRVALHGDPLIHDTMPSLREIARKQRWGAAAVRRHGPSLLAQSYADALREQVLVGALAMARGLRRGKLFWLAYPALLATKLAPYAAAAAARALSPAGGGRWTSRG